MFTKGVLTSTNNRCFEQIKAKFHKLSSENAVHRAMKASTKFHSYGNIMDYAGIESIYAID